MKDKFILLPFLMLFTFLLNTADASSIVSCDEVKMYCDYKGVFQNIDNTDEEFEMLLEPQKHANFQQMFGSLFYVYECSREKAECMKALKDPNCSISQYTKKLIKFYDDNKVKITDEYVIKMLEDLKKNERNINVNKKTDI